MRYKHFREGGAMSQQPGRAGRPHGRRQKKRAQGQEPLGRKRSIYIDPETDAMVVALARRLTYSESLVVVSLLRMAIAPFCGTTPDPEVAIAQRLKEFELHLVASPEVA
jgi:hypothetical protein